MRVKNKYRRISVTEEVYQMLHKDKAFFQENIGRGKWSISDTISQYIFMLKSLKKK